MCAALEGARLAIVGPLYPPEANGKGLTPSEFSFTFSVFNFFYLIVMVTSAPIVDKIGPHLGFVSCNSITGLAFGFFGLLHYVEDGNIFLILSFIDKAVEAIATAIADVTLMLIITRYYQESQATFLAIKEAFVAFGMCVGPPLAGFVFDETNFCVPFLGGGFFIVFATFLALIPIIGSRTEFKAKKEKNSASKKDIKPNKSAFTALVLPGVWIGFFSNTLANVAFGFLGALLEPYIRVFHYSEFTVSLFFVIPQVMFTTVNPIVGKMVDKKTDPMIFIILGSISQILCFILMGPVPSNNPQLWSMIVSCILNGIAYVGKKIYEGNLN